MYDGWLWLSILKITACPLPMSTTPAFSPGPRITHGASVGSSFSQRFDDLYEQCSLHITENTPSSVRLGARPSTSRMRAYSSGESPCWATIAGVMWVMGGSGLDRRSAFLAEASSLARPPVGPKECALGRHQRPACFRWSTRGRAASLKVSPTGFPRRCRGTRPHPHRSILARRMVQTSKRSFLVPCLARPPEESTMKSLTVRHLTAYRYTQPVRFGEHRLMFRPRDSHDMRLLETKLTISPPAQVRWLHDVFGNSVAIASFSDTAEERRFESEIRLEHYGVRETDFPLDASAEAYPFQYTVQELPDLIPSIQRRYPDPEGKLDDWVKTFY